MVDTSASLLERLRRTEDAESWDRFFRLYRPLLYAWLSRQGLDAADIDDVTQNTLLLVARKVGDFEHNQRPGAFRSWLKAIALNCLRDHWRAQKQRPKPAGGSDWGVMLEQLADPASEASGWWDQEHDRHVTRQLLDLLRVQFAPQTWEAFHRLVLLERPAAEVAAELHITPNAVYIAKSRVMARLRQEAAGLIELGEQN